MVNAEGSKKPLRLTKLPQEFTQGYSESLSTKRMLVDMVINLIEVEMKETFHLRARPVTVDQRHVQRKTFQ